MSPLTLKSFIKLLKEFTRTKGTNLEIILVGGLALYHYGMKDRITVDIDAEVKGDIEGLFSFLKQRGIPSDLGENMSGWSVVAMPPGYKERAEPIYKDERIVVKALNPLDFVVAKLRRGMEDDLKDASFVVKRFNLKAKDIKKFAGEAINNSSKDTAIFIFRRTVDLFLKRLTKQGESQ